MTTIRSIRTVPSKEFCYPLLYGVVDDTLI